MLRARFLVTKRGQGVQQELCILVEFSSGIVVYSTKISSGIVVYSTKISSGWVKISLDVI